MTREQKIELLKRRILGQCIDPSDLYLLTDPFIKVGACYYTDGYQWNETEFEALQQKMKSPNWIPGLWFIEMDANEAFAAWLMKYSKPISRRIVGMVEQCTEGFNNKIAELSNGGVLYV